MEIATSPRFFRQGPKPLTKFFVCASLSLAMLVGDARFSLLQQVREMVSVMLYPMQWAINTPIALSRQARDFLVTQAELEQDNRQLREKLIIMTARQQRYEELTQENHKLRELNNLQLPNKGDTRLAEVLYTSRDPFSHRIIVDKGQNSQIEAGFPVVDAHGLIGQVTRVAPLTAEVTLIIEKNHSVPVMVQRNGLRAVLFGTGEGLEVHFVANSADIQPNDLLLTSGIDGIYPAGLEVARVQNIDRNPASPFAQIRCIPIGGVGRERFALILTEKIELPAPPELEAAENSSPTNKKARQ